MAGISDLITLANNQLQVTTGWVQPVVLSPVGAGVATLARVVPGETYETVIAAHATFTASAVVGNRALTFDIVDGNGIAQISLPCAQAIAASGTVTAYAIADTSTAIASSGVSVVRLPSVLLPPGYTARFAAAGVDVADQWSSGGMLVERFPSDSVTILNAG